jgi:hypothetical protein
VEAVSLLSLPRDLAAHDPATQSHDPATEGTRPGWGTVVGAACLPAVASYLTAVVVLALLAAAGGADGSMAGVARAGAVGWLAAHHVALTIDEAPLGVLPLLPTLLLGALVAHSAAGVAMRSGLHQPADAGRVAGVIAATHGILGAFLALAATPATVTADPAQAAVGCALLAGAAAGLGLARPCGLLPAVLRRAPDWVRPGLGAGLWGLAVLLTAGLATVLIALAVSAPQVVRMSGPDAGSAFGLSVLSLGYLPNAAIAGLSWLAGPGLSIGALSVSPVAVHAGPVPAVPLLAALPQGGVQPWWGVVLAVPLLVGAAVGRRCAAVGSDLLQRLRALGAAALVLALGSAVLGALAGGRLGAAAFNPVDVPSGPLAGAVLAATLLAGCAVTLLSAPGMPAKPSPSPEPCVPAEPSTPDDASSDDTDHDAVPDGEGAPGSRDGA